MAAADAHGSDLRRLRAVVAALARPEPAAAAPDGGRRRRSAARAASIVPSAAMASPPPPATYTHARRFGTHEGEAMLEFFHREGYAVVKAALNPAEAAHAMDLTWEYL